MDPPGQKQEMRNESDVQTTARTHATLTVCKNGDETTLSSTQRCRGLKGGSENFGYPFLPIYNMQSNSTGLIQKNIFTFMWRGLRGIVLSDKKVTIFISWHPQKTGTGKGGGMFQRMNSAKMPCRNLQTVKTCRSKNKNKDIFPH